MKYLTRKNIITLLILGILLFGLYMFNSEKVFPEYWLQRKFDKHRIEKLDNVTLSNKSLSYQLVYNDKIDLYISLYSNGIVSISINIWNTQKQQRTTYFNSDPDLIKELIDEFNRLYPQSETKGVDDHLSKYYSVMTVKNSTTGDNKKVEVYNVKPDKKFKKMKNKIITFAKRKINEIIK